MSNRSIPPPELAAQDSALFGELSASGFGPFDDFHWENLGQINVLVGRNDTGKSTLLKLYYSLARSVQDFTRRMTSDRPTFGEVLAEKLMWTFQPGSARLGDLVKKRSAGAYFGATLCNADYGAALSPSDGRSIGETQDGGPQPTLRALFVPPKEILTSIDAIMALHEQDKSFGFDDTYYDLAVALRGDVKRDALPDSLCRVLDSLRSLFSGEIVREEGKLMFQRGMDVAYWDAPRDRLVLLEVKDYTGREAPTHLISSLVAKGRDCLIMLQSAWRGDTETGASLCLELPERLRSCSRLDLIFVLKVDDQTRMRPINEMRDQLVWSIQAYRKLLGLLGGRTMLMDQQKAFSVGLPLRSV